MCSMIPEESLQPFQLSTMAACAHGCVWTCSTFLNFFGLSFSQCNGASQCAQLAAMHEQLPLGSHRQDSVAVAVCMALPSSACLIVAREIIMRIPHPPSLTFQLELYISFTRIHLDKVHSSRDTPGAFCGAALPLVYRASTQAQVQSQEDELAQRWLWC